MSNLVFWWQYPRWRDFYLRLARSFRLILFDKRGTGSLRPRRPVRDSRDADGGPARGARRRGIVEASDLGAHEGSRMAALFAASYPERTRALVLFHARAAAPLTAPTPSAAAGVSGRSPRPMGRPGVARRALQGGCGRRSLRTRTIGDCSLIPYGSEPPPRSHTRSTAPSSRLTCAMCCPRCTSRRSSSTAPCRRRRRRRWTSRRGSRARRRCAYPAPTRPRSSSRPSSQTRSTGSLPAKKPRLSRERSLRDCRFHRHRRLHRARAGARRPRLARPALPPSRDRPAAARPFRGTSKTRPETASSPPSTARTGDPVRRGDHRRARTLGLKRGRDPRRRV